MSNAMELIQQLKDYFKTEHGLTVTVEIKSHTSYNDVEAQKAAEIAKDIQQVTGGEIWIDQSDEKQVAWACVRDYDKGFGITIFHKPEVQ